MKQGYAKRALVALFLALIYVPTLVGLAAGDRFRSENLENRTLAELPALSLDAIPDLPGAFVSITIDRGTAALPEYGLTALTPADLEAFADYIRWTALG